MISNLHCIAQMFFHANPMFNMIASKTSVAIVITIYVHYVFTLYLLVELKYCERLLHLGLIKTT